MMLIDDAARRASEGAWSLDRDGELAARGRVDAALLSHLLAHPFLKQLPPKTTGREMFGAPFAEEIWKSARGRGLRGEDVVATVTAFTAQYIARAYRQFLPRFPEEVILSGGGARNPTLVKWLRQELAPARVILSDEVGLPVEAKEAIAFAILAYETAHGRGSNLPSATGASHAVILGDITPGAPLLSALLEADALTESLNPATA